MHQEKIDARSQRRQLIQDYEMRLQGFRRQLQAVRTRSVPPSVHRVLEKDGDSALTAFTNALC